MEHPGAVSVVDIRHLDDPHQLAAAISDALGSTGFLFIRGHGLEEQAQRMFELSGKRIPSLVPNNDELIQLSSCPERFFRDETEAEKARCAYADNKGYTKVSQER